MSRVNPQQLEQIRAANDIVDVIGTHVQLKRAGGSMKGLCPFHKEKSPSFNVNPARQMFYCFGCHKGGDVFRFVMDFENVDFPTALRMLAERAGIRVEWEDGNDSNRGPAKDVLYRINDQIAAFYQRVLLEHPSAERARQYLQDRKLGAEIVESFRIGFAPEREDSLFLWAKKNGYDLEQMSAAGLLSQGESGDWYDRFRGRLMFPLRDEQGRVAGFSGRVLHKDQHPAKYVNTPETILFKKGRLLYALDRARKAILESRTATICEGQIDVIRCHSAGIDTAVAALGTALTDDHARLLKRYADGVLLVMDADNAGQTSAIRTAEVFLAAGLSVRVASLPPGEDPDSLILKNGPDALREIMARNQAALDFQIDVLSKRDDPKTEAGLMRISRELLSTIAKAPTAVQREQMIQQAARRLGLPVDAFHRDLRNVKAAPAPRQDDSPAPAAPPSHPIEEVSLAQLLLHHPETAALVSQYVKPGLLEDADCRLLIAALLEHPGSDTGLANALDEAGSEAQRLAAELSAGSGTFSKSEVGPDRAARDLVLAVHKRHLMRRRRELELQRAQATGEAHARLDIELKQMILDLKHLQRGWDLAEPILALHAAG